MARAIDVPTQDAQAKRTLASEVGWPRRNSLRARGATSRAGIIKRRRRPKESEYASQVYHPHRRMLLASASPRRRELLTRAGYTFDIEPSGADERRLDDERPADFVVRIAVAKAVAVSGGPEDQRLIVAADTIVVVDGEVLGKPRGSDDAVSMLRRLSGRTHEVLTGVAVVRGVDRRTALASTRVTLVGLDDQAVGAYVATGEPMDKAGAYGVQGIASRFVDRIEGSYTNVVGLPLTAVERLLKELDDGL